MTVLEFSTAREAHDFQEKLFRWGEGRGLWKAPFTERWDRPRLTRKGTFFIVVNTRIYAAMTDTEISNSKTIEKTELVEETP